MPIGRYMAWVGTALLALLFVTNWFLPQSLADPLDEINRPVIRIASIQQPPERIVIDTNLPTIVPPPTLSADAATDEPPQQVRPSAPAIPRIPVAAAEKRKPKAKKQLNEVAAKAPRAVPTTLVARSGTATNTPPNRLSFANIISGQLVRDLFNLE